MHTEVGSAPTHRFCGIRQHAFAQREYVQAGLIAVCFQRVAHEAVGEQALDHALLGRVIARIEVKRAQLRVNDVGPARHSARRHGFGYAQVTCRPPNGWERGVTAHVIGVRDLCRAAPALARNQPLRAARGDVAGAGDVDQLAGRRFLTLVFLLEVSIDQLGKELRARRHAPPVRVPRDVIERRVAEIERAQVLGHIAPRTDFVCTACAAVDELSIANGKLAAFRGGQSLDRSLGGRVDLTQPFQRATLIHSIARPSQRETGEAQHGPFVASTVPPGRLGVSQLRSSVLGQLLSNWPMLNTSSQRDQ